MVEAAAIVYSRIMPGSPSALSRRRFALDKESNNRSAAKAVPRTTAEPAERKRPGPCASTWRGAVSGLILRLFQTTRFRRRAEVSQ